MAVPDEFRAGELRDAFVQISGVLDEHTEALDSLDAEADGSVGSDVAATMATALTGTSESGDLLTLTSTMARGAARVATGPAGRVLTELFKCLNEVVSGADSVDAQRFALMLELMAERLSERERTPEPGRLGAVVAASSVGALEALDQGLSLVEVVIAAADEGLDELESGIANNPALAERGVVDAAGAAYLLILDSLAAIIGGDPLPHAPVSTDETSGVHGTRFVVGCVVLPADEQHTERSSWLESCAWLESAWHELGVLGRFEIIGSRCLVELETTEPGRAIETLCSVGRPTELNIALSSSPSRNPGPRPAVVPEPVLSN